MALNTDFYANVAQVLAIVTLALVWDTKYFDKEHMEAFESRPVWKPWLVRGYSMVFVGTAISGIGLCLAVLGGLFTNSTGLRIAVGILAAVTLITLSVRMVGRIRGRDDLSSLKEAKEAKEAPPPLSSSG